MTNHPKWVCSFNKESIDGKIDGATLSDSLLIDVVTYDDKITSVTLTNNTGGGEEEGETYQTISISKMTLENGDITTYFDGMETTLDSDTTTTEWTPSNDIECSSGQVVRVFYTINSVKYYNECEIG